MASFTKYTPNQEKPPDLLRWPIVKDVDRVIAFAESISGDRAKAVEWLNQPLEEFGGKTPLQLVAEGRTDDVIGYLQSFESGYVG